MIKRVFKIIIINIIITQFSFLFDHSHNSHNFQAQLDEFELMREEYKEKREDSISLSDDVASDDEN